MAYRFIDLFAGLGGFHLALEALGHECVFASELRPDLQELYKINFPGANIKGDITAINARKGIPPHDILCAGFPCQPFSQAGKRMGFADEGDRGNLFYYICDILFAHQPKFIFLENVSNLMGHDGGNTITCIKSKLKELSYDVKTAVLSPHQFGISQHRKRVFIVGINTQYGNLDNFSFLSLDKKKEEFCDVSKVVELTKSDDKEIVKLKPETRNQLNVWQEFIDLTIANGEKIPSFPIWAMEFGATYSYQDIAPAHQTLTQLQGTKGHLGTMVNGVTKEECLSQLPVYARTSKDKEFPNWKKKYITQNRDFYNRNKSWIDNWLLKVRNFENSHLKLEWNCGSDAIPTLWDKIIQFRASGIRVKLPNFIPALNLVGTQVPILPWVKLPDSIVAEGEPARGRYLTVSEGAAVQGMQKLDLSTLSASRRWEALGNAVNVTLVRHIAKNLLVL